MPDRRTAPASASPPSSILDERETREREEAEGVLFQVNQNVFVQTKRKLTNLLFFTKGKPTERVWYYDLADVKVGKKCPLTLAHTSRR